MMNDREKKVFERILSPECPTCGSHDTVEEKDAPPAIFIAVALPQFNMGKPQKKVNIIRCNKCHSIHQSDGSSIVVK